VADVYGFGGYSPSCLLIWGCNITYSGASGGMCGGMVNRALKGADHVIVVDPRRIGPAQKAHFLQIRPGTDGALALAMIHVLIAEDLIDHEFVDNHTLGFEALKTHVRKFSPVWAVTITGFERVRCKPARAT
jgi:thiosulfate reductase / polysulfide reductase chain A